VIGRGWLGSDTLGGRYAVSLHVGGVIRGVFRTGGWMSRRRCLQHRVSYKELPTRHNPRREVLQCT